LHRDEDTGYRYPGFKTLPVTAANTCSWTHCQTNDVAFAVALVERINSNMCVDVARVYATGSSNGGMFTCELGQNAASVQNFRAISPLIGLPHRGYPGAQAKTNALGQRVGEHDLCHRCGGPTAR
jgi:poly(3-hydroxybutyrate) depolymerase